MRSSISCNLLPKALVLLLLLIARPSAVAESKPDEPEAGTDRIWIKEYLRIKALTGQSFPKAPMDLCFLGDSLTAFWPATAPKVWRSEFGKLQVINAGLSGDTTQNILYRVQNGNFHSLQPRVIVLMAGINNLGLDPAVNPAAVARGVAKIVHTLREKSPSSKILVLSLLPSAEAANPIRQRIRQTNDLLARLPDGTSVFYFDLHDRFLDKTGALVPGLTLDGTHLTPLGYQVWADAMRPVLIRLLPVGR